ncbi:MAG: hypothetical protein ABL927_06520 [Bdellovibrionales bacterium]
MKNLNTTKSVTSSLMKLFALSIAALSLGLFVTLVFSLKAQASDEFNKSEHKKISIAELSEVAEAVQTEVAYYSYESDAGTCGGHVLDFKINKVEESVLDDGSKVSDFEASFSMTKDVNYCSSELVFECVAKIRKFSEVQFQLTDWDCVRAQARN